MKGMLIILNMLIHVAIFGQQEYNIKYKDTVIYKLIDYGDGYYSISYYNKFKEIKFVSKVNKSLEYRQDLIAINNDEINWMITFYNDSLIDITHHMTDSIKPYCLPCNGYSKKKK